jgi:hypothetical protein
MSEFFDFFSEELSFSRANGIDRAHRMSDFPYGKRQKAAAGEDAP